MKRVLYVIAAVAVAVASRIVAEPVPAELAQGRDLRAYDDGGVYRAVVGGYIADVQRLREFVWTHWTKKRRGYVEIVFQNMDTGTKAYLFIEPTDEHWRIYWDELYYSAVGSEPMRPTLYPTIVTVERCRGSLIFFDADDRIVKYL